MVRGLKKTSLILLMFVLVTMVGCTQKNKEDTRPQAKGFIWEATSKEGKKVTLVGTMHPASNTHRIYNDNLQEIMSTAEVLSVEVDTTMDSSIKKLQQSMYLQKGETIENYLSIDDISKLGDMLKPYKQKIEDIKSLNAYGINQVLLSNLLGEMGFTGTTTDLILMQEAQKNKIKIDEIEGIDFQINLLKEIYSWEGLKEYIQKYNDKVKNEEIMVTEELFDNYANGDIDKAEAKEKSLRVESGEEAYKRLNLDRNINMAQKIDELIKDNKKRVVAVGYRHFMGEGGVLDNLEELGYTINPIE